MARVLAIVDHGYRGLVEVQFADVLYVCQGLHRQLGGLDLALYGAAVTYALDAAPVPPPRLGTRSAPKLADPRTGLAALVKDGAQVFADPADLAALGLDPGRLVDGVGLAARAELTTRWATYEEGVWFL